MTLQSRVKIVMCLLAVLSLMPINSFAQTSPTFSGRAVAVRANAVGITIALADTGALPATGGDLKTSLASVDVLGLILVDALSSATSGSGNTSQSQSSVVNLSLLAGLVAADVVQSQATANCSSGQASVSGKSDLVGLVVAGQPVLTVNPNIAIALPGGLSVIINEQTSSPSGGNTGTTTVNALHVTGPGIDIVVASSEADITCP